MTDRPGEGYIESYSQGVKALLGAVSGEPIVEHSPELIFDINLESGNPEFSYLLGSQLWTSAPLISVAVATQLSQTDALNPVGSGVIDVITKIRILAPVAAARYVLVFPSSQASGGVAAAAVKMDGRARLLTSIQFSSGAPVAVIPTPQANERDGPAQQFDIELNEPSLMDPGRRASLFCSVVNTQMRS